MKEFIPAVAIQKYIHRYWIVESTEAMPAEKCVMDGFVKLFIYLNDNLPVYTDKQGKKREWGDGIGGHPFYKGFFTSVYVGRAWRNIK